MTVAEYIVAYLSQIGVKYLFGVDGANIEDIYDAAYHSDTPITALLAKHEFSAACMADGFSRIDGEVSVVMATSGGGCLNLVPGLAESHSSKQPVLAIVGMPPSQLEGLGAFQDASGFKGSLDGQQLFISLASKYFYRITSADSIQFHLHQAVSNAMSKPYGTAVLMIPKDVQQSPINPDSSYHFRSPMLTHLPQAHIHLSLLDMLNKTKFNSMLLIGKSVTDKHSIGLIEQLAQCIGAKIAVSPVAKHLFKSDNPLYLGISGIAGHANVLKYSKQCQLMVIIGTNLPLMTRAGLEPCLDSQSIIYINETEIHYDFKNNDNPIFQYIGEISAILTNFIQQYQQNRDIKAPFVQSTIKGCKLVYNPPCFFGSHVDGFNFESIFKLFNQFIYFEDICFADAGNTGGATIHYLKSTRYFGIALGMGGMGYAIGASIGACLKTKQRTYCFLGDGAFYMHGMEIHTAIEYNLPMRFIVFNNNSHAMCYAREKIYYKGEYSYNLFKPSMIGSGCQAMFPGFYSKDIDNLTDLNQCLTELQDYQGPALISLTVDHREIPPFAPFLALKED